MAVIVKFDDLGLDVDLRRILEEEEAEDMQVDTACDGGAAAAAAAATVTTEPVLVPGLVPGLRRGRGISVPGYCQSVC